MRIIPSQFVSGMIAGGAVLSAGFVLGGAAFNGQPAVVPEVVRARQFEVVDEVGTVRLVLGANEEGGSMSVRDRLGRTMLLAGASPHGGMLVVTNAAAARPALAAGATESGGTFQLFDRNGARVVEAVAIDRGGRMTISSGAETARGAGRRTGLELSVAGDGAGALTAYGPQGGPAVKIMSDVGGGGVMETYQSAEEHPLVRLSSTASGHGQIKTMAKGGAPLVMLTATADDEGHIYTLNGDGRTMVAIASRPAGPTLRVYNHDGDAVVTLEADAEGVGTVGVWRPDGIGRTIEPE